MSAPSAMSQGMFGSDVSYWPEWSMTTHGRTCHLHRLDVNGLGMDVALCGVKFWGSEQGRGPEVDPCRKCVAIADRHDDLAARANPQEPTARRQGDTT